MTMPARRASKLSAKRRAVTPEVFSQSLVPQGIPGFCEPWSECQPEESRPPEGRPEDSSIYMYTCVYIDMYKILHVYDMLMYVHIFVYVCM